MKRYGDRLALYLSLLILLSLVSYPEALAMTLQHRYADFYGQRSLLDNLFKLVRELLFVVIFVETIWQSIRIGRSIRAYLLYAAALVMLLSIILIKDALLYGEIDASIFGIRFLLILNIACSAWIATRYQPDFIFHPLLGKSIGLWLSASILFAAMQLYDMPPFFGKTLIGTRTQGLSPQPIHFSMTLAAVALYLFVTDRLTPLRELILLLVTLSTGGRAGIIALMALLIFRHARSARTPRVILLLLMPAILIGLYFFVSNAWISGRIGTEGGLLGEGRLNTWGIAMDSFAGDPWRILLGNMLGFGANFYGIAEQRGFAVDSMYISILLNFGLAGLILLGLAAWQATRGGDDRVLASVGVLLFLGVAQNVVEIHPVNLLVLACIGASLAVNRGRSTESVDFARPG